MSATTTTVPALSGLVLDLDEQEYHALPGLSSTGAKMILRSPAHYQEQRRNPPKKAAYDLGHAAHADVLGTGLEVVRVDADDWRTKVAKDERDAAYAAGKVPLLAKDADRARAIADAVRAHQVAGRLFTDGAPEVSAFWTDEATGVLCRGRFDYLRDLGGRHVLVDLKTAQDADPEHFGRTALNLGYDVQTWHYLDGYAAITGEPAAFLHVLVEVEPPYAVSVVQLDDDALYVGGLKARRAREMFRDCTDADSWPAYSTEIEPVSLPRWAMADAEERYA